MVIVMDVNEPVSKKRKLDTHKDEDAPTTASNINLEYVNEDGDFLV